MYSPKKAIQAYILNKKMNKIKQISLHGVMSNIYHRKLYTIDYYMYYSNGGCSYRRTGTALMFATSRYNKVFEKKKTFWGNGLILI